MPDIAASLGSVLELWRRGSLLLWALGVASLLTTLILALAAYLRPDLDTLHWLPAAVIATAVFFVLAAFKTYQERTYRTLVFIPDDAQSFWSHAPQPNGRKLTQIALRARATNISGQPIYPSDVRLLSPRPKRVVQRLIFTEQETGRTYGSNNAISPGSRGNISAHFFADGFVGEEGKPLTIVVSVSDQLGHWHKVRFQNLPSAAGRGR